ncbi:MAG TPA: YigZ family protein [Anaerolineaceae bacterium]|nr:YigZ family protein [Anaerolineaceae bacterium]
MTETPFIIPAGETEAEIVIEKSRFIATLAPAFRVEDARAFVDRVKSRYPDASHHVPAFVIGHGASTIEHSSDAGEPSGTAGRPVLTVLKGSGLGDAVLVVTRYFGGIKLGTGGLVRAYTQAAKEVIEQAPRAQKMPTHTAMAAFPYTYFERIKQLVEEQHGLLLDQDFGSDVTLTMRFPSERFADFQAALIELTRGAIQAEVIETQVDTIVPL